MGARQLVRAVPTSISQHQHEARAQAESRAGADGVLGRSVRAVQRRLYVKQRLVI